MSSDPRPASIVGPRHVVGGRWRRRVELAAVGLVVAPYVVVVVVSVVVLLRTGAWPLVGLFVFYGLALYCWAPLRRAVVWSWWRVRWWHDCRASGIAANAEAGLFGRDDGATDRDHLVVAPFLRRLRMTDTGRFYDVRVLPGQTVGQYEEALGRMEARWNATRLSVEHVPGGKYVRLIVETKSPRRELWEAPR